jgi:hypothetical protein
MPIFGMLYFTKLFFNLRLDLTVMYISVTVIMIIISDCIQMETDTYTWSSLSVGGSNQNILD